tara:strand:- start:18 stop:311 length:294 start_codon:yes stop_codon:yes gene_type:complete
MFDIKIEPSKIGTPYAVATQGRGFTPEEIAERCSDNIVSISDETLPPLREQAIAFKKQVSALVAIYIRQAIKSDRTTLYNELNKLGEHEFAEILRRL